MFGSAKVKAAVGAAAAVLALVTGQVVADVQPAAAANAANFNAGNIISDTMFYNIRMSEADIQSFLVSKGSWLAGHRQTTTTKPSGNYSDGGNATGWGVCGQYNGAADELASTIIFKVQNACGVSAQTLLATLQKESGLVTSGTSSYLRSAMGYGCPDTADCDSNYYWFFNQMFGAARSFQWYGNQAPGGYSSKKYAVGWWNIAYQANNPGCGTKSVYVENRATAALYYYTPYTPNQAALANLYGTGDGCSAYGNRNFWRIFTDWFGSTQIIPGAIQFVKSSYNDVLGRAPETDAVVNNWGAAMTSGLSREAMAGAFNNSDEYRLKKTEQAYMGVLQRLPEQAGRDNWLNAMRTGQISPEDVYAVFLSTDEMYFGQGGGTNSGYVTALYMKLLGRAPDPAGLQAWVSLLDQGQPRSIVSNGIWYSPEKYNVRVNEAYVSLLGRNASPAEQAIWTAVAQRSGSAVMRIQIMASDEYWARALSRY